MKKAKKEPEEKLSKAEIQEQIGISQKHMLKNTVSMAWPSVLESFLISLVGFLDTIMISSLGLSAIAAISLATQPKFVALAIFIGLSVAVSSVVSRRKGQNDRESANRIVKTAILACIGLTIITSLVFVLGADFIINLAGSAEDTHEMAVVYFSIIMAGIGFTTISLVINAAQRGAGRTKVSMVTNITSNIINVIFNFLLIQGRFGFPALGIVGAAVATVLGSMVACAMSFISITKPDGFIYIKYNKGLADKHDVHSVLDVGSSSFVEQIFTRAGFFILLMIVANLGTVALAAHQIATSFTAIAFSVSDGLAVASVALVGRSLGEGNKERARAYSSICQKLGLLLSVVLSLVYFIFKYQLFGLFTDDAEVMAYCPLIMNVVCVGLYVQMQSVTVLGGLRGAGDTKYTAFVSLISVTIVRPIVSYLLCYTFGFGLVGIWLGFVTDQSLRCILGHIRFRSGVWLNKVV